MWMVKAGNFDRQFFKSDEEAVSYIIKNKWAREGLVVWYREQRMTRPITFGKRANVQGQLFVFRDQVERDWPRKNGE